MLIVARIIAVLAAAVAAHTAQVEEFVWRYGSHTIGHLTVPAGFVIEAYDYREGIVTRLHYKDGAYIILQSGGMYRVPLFQDPDQKLLSSAESAAKTIRVGQFVGSTLCWREDNFKRKKVSGATVTLSNLLPPNVGYTKVPQARRAEFDRALDSFVWEIERSPSGGR
jgi:hypothetical protein